SRSVDQLRVKPPPLSYALRPFVGQLRQSEEPSARIFAALGVMGGGGGEPLRSLACALLHAPMKISNRERARCRIAADLIEGETAVVAVERGVLERLGHHRPTELLRLERKLPIARNAVAGSAWRDEIKRERVAQK